MKRRKALKLTAGLMGVTIIGSELFLSGCTNEIKDLPLFSDSDINLLDEVGEVILPRTEQSAGAKDVEIGLFMKSIVTDCYSKKEQDVFKKGMKELDRISRNAFSRNFLELDQNEKYGLIVKLDKETSANKENESLQFFKMMKQLTIWGYFTSEQGATKALRYNQIPGKFIGCIPYNNGDKAWS